MYKVYTVYIGRYLVFISFSEDNDHDFTGFQLIIFCIYYDYICRKAD